MKTIIQNTIFTLSLLAGVVAAPALVATPVAANDACTDTNQKVTGINQGKNCAKGDDQQGNFRDLIRTVTNVLLFIIGAIAVIMIIIGGIKYVVSNGDSTQITSAKNTILYAVVGIVVALLAYAIVGFVIDSFVPGEESGSSGRRAT